MAEPTQDAENEDDGFKLTLHDFDPAAIDVDALSSAVAAAVVHVPAMDRVDIVISGSFEAYVRESDSDELAAHYRQERLLGGARAKVIDRGGGRCELLVDALVVDRDRADDEDPSRVFVHEALHIAAGQRGETLTGRRARLGFRQGTAAGMIAGLAGIAGEEFRVQRGLADLGLPLESAYRDELRALVDAYRKSLRVPLKHWIASADIEDLAEAVLTGFEYLMTIVAYVIADDVASQGLRAPDLGSLGDPRWLATSYPGLRASLEALPAATTATPLEQLDDLADAIESGLEDWLAEIGFGIRDTRTGLFLDVFDLEGLQADLDSDT